MTIPTDYDVTITINGVDATIYIPHSSMSQDDYTRQVGTLRFRVENPVGITPERNHEVIVIANSLPGTPAIFLGYIRELKTTKNKNGINVFYECECADRKILLQRSIIDTDVLSGSDTDILSALLTNTYPDLSSYFDFSTNVSGFANDLSLPVGNSNLLDALNDLAELTGAEFSFNNAVGNSTDQMTFEGGDSIALVGTTEPYIAYPTLGGSGGGTLSPNTYSIQSGGNPGSCLRWNPTSGSPSGNYGFHLLFYLTTSANERDITGMTFDYYLSSDLSGASLQQLLVNIFPSVGIGQSGAFTPTFGSWQTVDVSTASGIAFPITLGKTTTTNDINISYLTDKAIADASVSDIDMRFDNIVLTLDPPFADGTNTFELNWDDIAPDADFDFDIDLSNDYGFDFDLFEGDYDDYNSITIVGGNAEDAVDWTYPNQDNQTHIDLETAISNIAVYKNTGTEGTPTWTAQTVGTFGTDDLANVDVLYDKIDHWLYFAVAPPNFADAIRVTGSILRPIRVRVENVADGEPTYATIVENTSITSIDQAVAIGDSKLSKRNAPKSLTFKTYQPGLKVGQSLTVADSNRGLNETLTIQRIATQWLGGTKAEFTVECGSDEIVGVDTIIANNDKRSRNNQLAAGATVVTAVFYTGDSGNRLTDDSENTLYGYE